MKQNVITKRYNLINNLGGWFVFLVALVTYWLTLEPTASYWDCGEFIIQADKLEVGHPPGNPIFMLTARFFANFAPSAEYISVMVNAMSGLFSALTILLLFWTITHLTRALLTRPGLKRGLTLSKIIAIMGSGLVGALAYCWSDTFWFSAVEGEVYAFSSFCTALVFWLILKWENRADQPHSDRYLILIAYIIGVSVAVHLLNLLCIPAIVLVFAYRRIKDMNLVKSLIALGISFGIIFVVLYGLVPGFIKVAQQFELFFVNSVGLPYNAGALIYAIVAVGIFCWALMSLRSEKSANSIRISFLGAVFISGALWFGNSVWTWILLTIALGILLWTLFRNRLPVRWLNIAAWSMAVIFVGYSSYALILIRSSAATPMNQNAPDNVFDLASYLNREQYGENPLLYGETLNSSPMKRLVGTYVDTVAMYDDGTPLVLNTPRYETIVEKGRPMYSKVVGVTLPESEYNFLTPGDQSSNAELTHGSRPAYVKRDYKPETRMNPELNMIFPRIYSRLHRSYYPTWVSLDTLGGSLEELHAIDEAGNKVPEFDVGSQPDYNEATGVVSYPVKRSFRPGFLQNLSYFFNYQLNHMYTRYFMWNFVGRQNDILNQQGELDAGNWISGIPFIDNTRLGDQSLLPDDLGKGNPAHNTFYFLPLILGLIGLLWQAFAGKKGIEQFWVVFFLFFMTGIAIVLYLNQPPQQPRERDYAFAGSFYAFAIWIGLGVAAIWRFLLLGWRRYGRPARRIGIYTASVATLIGLVIPLQMVSQTWDDHDRSGRFAARDYAVNYLESLEPNAIVFCNGDNDTFPLWYAQEVEGVRPDVKIVNLSYLNSDWYANQMRLPSYTAPGIGFTATPADYAYGRADVALLGSSTAPADLLESIKSVYQGSGRDTYGYPAFPSRVVSIPVDKQKVLARGLVAPEDSAQIVDYITVDLSQTDAYRKKGYISLGELLMLDIIATNAANGWERPIYWAMTVGDEYHLGLTPYLRSTGMTHQIVPTRQAEMATRTDRAYDVVTKKYRWGGADVKDGARIPYFDETARRMLVSVRTSMVDLATQLLADGDRLAAEGKKKEARQAYQKTLRVLDMIQSNTSPKVAPLNIANALTSAQIYCELGADDTLGDKDARRKGLAMLEALMERYAPYVRYSTAMTMQFGRPSLTYESQLLPYQYQRIVDLWLKYGGSKARADEIMKSCNLDPKRIKEYYDHYTGAATSSSDSGMEGISMDELASEIGKWSEIANELAAMSPADYAATSTEERMIDSAVWTLVDYYLANGGSEAELEKNANYRKLDKERAKRLSQENAD